MSRLSPKTFDVLLRPLSAHFLIVWFHIFESASTICQPEICNKLWELSRDSKSHNPSLMCSNKGIRASWIFSTTWFIFFNQMIHFLNQVIHVFQPEDLRILILFEKVCLIVIQRRWKIAKKVREGLSYHDNIPTLSFLALCNTYFQPNGQGRISKRLNVPHKQICQ